MHRNRDVVAVDQAVEAAEGRGLFEAEQEEFEKVVKTKALHICLQFVADIRAFSEILTSHLRSTSEGVRYSWIDKISC